jgi:hypothetical protein
VEPHVDDAADVDRVDLVGRVDRLAAAVTQRPELAVRDIVRGRLEAAAPQPSARLVRAPLILLFRHIADLRAAGERAATSRPTHPTTAHTVCRGRQ